ncbi:MAG: TlpA family protein disulfide reductase [Rhodospirillaceae bacterium]|nr:TlpA family protein disulfide reductase [Rhodospirillaceae bacterium]
MMLQKNPTAVLVAMFMVLIVGAPPHSAISETIAPHLDAQGRAGYEEFLNSPPHSAFVIAPGGTWSWVSGMASQLQAEESALDACATNTEQTCHLFSVDGQTVFNTDAWKSSWVLGADSTLHDGTSVGTKKGMAFPDLALNAPDGTKVSLKDFRSNVVFLHFWGSWCPPCQSEFPDLQTLYNMMAKENVVKFVLVQAREPIERSRAWAKRKEITMPLFDSGHQGRSDEEFKLSDASAVANRLLASAYPSTYVLDKKGRVVFHKSGAGHNWIEYADLLRELSKAN